MRRLISFVIPVYNEAGNLELLHDTLSELLAARAADYDFEFLYVNDGSRDESLDTLENLRKDDDRVVVVNFARNFGHQIAVTAGLDHARGDAVIIMDGDMQDPPRVSLDLLARWEEGYDVVYAQRRTRKDTFFKRFTAAAFYLVLEKAADIHIPRNTGDFRLIDRRVVDVLSSFHEHNRFLRGLVSYVGFRQTAVLFDRDPRHSGSTGYPLSRMISFALDGIFGFSSAPLRLINRLGIALSAVSFAGMLYVLISKLVTPSRVVPGWSFIVIAILLIGGLQLMMLGVLGNYVGRIYTEVQNRPLYILESVRGRGDSAGDTAGRRMPHPPA